MATIKSRSFKQQKIVSSLLVNGVLIFEDETSHLVEIDFRGTADEVAQRIAPAVGEPKDATAPAEATPDAPRGPGRPKLGVVSRLRVVLL